jgi:hypothetical protein
LTPPGGAEIYRPTLSGFKEGDALDSVEQEAQMPSSLRLAAMASVPAVAGAHLIVVWWHQRVGEPDEFMQIAYDAAMDSSFSESTISFSELAQPWEENLICWRACRDRSLCPCQATPRFALGSVLVAIDQDGDGALSLDELRAEQIGGATTLIGWSSVQADGIDSPVDVVHQGFAAYYHVPGSLFEARTSTTAPAAALSFCTPGDQSCTFPVEHVFCNLSKCSDNFGLDRFGL